MILIRKAIALIIAALLIIFGDAFGAGDQQDTLQIKDFHFSYSAGMYMNSGNDYDVEINEDEEAIVRVRLDGVYSEDVPEIVADDEFLEQLSQILIRNDVPSWDGFSESNDGVLDGDSFLLSYTTTDGQIVTAHGYMMWPDNYGTVRAQLEELFVGLYNSIYPDKMDMLENYYRTQILTGRDELKLVDISYPYMAVEDDMFIYGQAEVPEGIIGWRCGNYTGGPVWDYDRDQSDMIVLYLYNEPAEDRPDYNQTWLSFEIYTVNEDMQVQLLGGDWVESNAFWNDGIYAYLFTHEYEDKNYLGYFSEKKTRAGGNTVRFTLYLYELKPDGPELIEAEVLEGSLDRDTWEYEDLELFSAIAEKYGFNNSLKYWKEHPFDPVIVDQDMNAMMRFLTSSNYGKGFIDALESTPVGEPIGDFLITGEIRSMIIY